MNGLDFDGDWHGQMQVTPATWYSGTPEPDGFKHDVPGAALLVIWQAVLAEGLTLRPLVLHADKGSPMKGATTGHSLRSGRKKRCIRCCGF